MKGPGAILVAVLMASACSTGLKPENGRPGKLMGRWEGSWINPETRKSDFVRLVFRHDSTVDYFVNGKKLYTGPFRTLADTMMIWQGDSVYYHLLHNQELKLWPSNGYTNGYEEAIWPVYQITFYR